MNSETLSYVERRKCPVYSAIRVIEGRWKPMIFRRLGERPQGIGGSPKKYAWSREQGTSPASATARSGRHALRESSATNHPRRVRYALTRHGRTLGPVFEALWELGHVPPRQVTPRFEYRSTIGPSPLKRCSNISEIVGAPRFARALLLLPRLPFPHVCAR